MELFHLSKTVNIKTVSEDEKRGVFEIDGLYTGYGLTLGNAIRRILFSSLPGAAVTQIKIKNVPHEFSTLPGVKEDMVELTLNFRKLRFRMHTDEPQVLALKIKGEKVATGADIKTNTQVEVVNPEEVLATLTEKNTELDVELEVRRGLGFSPTETRKSEEKLPIGTIAIDAFFSPVTKVNFIVENMRVGDRTDFNRLRLEIETDGIISPSSALHKAASILKDHAEKVLGLQVKEFELAKAETKTPQKKRIRKTKTAENKISPKGESASGGKEEEKEEE